MKQSKINLIRRNRFLRGLDSEIWEDLVAKTQFRRYQTATFTHAESVDPQRGAKGNSWYPRHD